MSLPDWTNNAVLLYGPRKGGTTLVQNLHDGGEELLVFPSELKLKYFCKMIWKAQPEAAKAYIEKSSILGKSYQNFDIEGYAAYAGGLSEKEISNLRDLIRNDAYGIYENIKVKKGAPKLWAAKEVGGDAGRIISFWRQMFFDGKVVLILRDPLMVTRSVIMERKRRAVRLSVVGLWRQVKEPLYVLYDQVQLIGDKSVYFVVYEDIVENPKDVMTGVCDYLGIEYCSCFEYPTIFGERVVVKTSSKETKTVFKEKKKWRDGLSVRESLTVWLCTLLVTKRLQMKKGVRKFSSYGNLVRQLKES